MCTAHGSDGTLGCVAAHCWRVQLPGSQQGAVTVCGAAVGRCCGRSQGLRLVTNVVVVPTPLFVMRSNIAAPPKPCRLDEVAFHFSFTYYNMLGGGQGPAGLSQLAALYLDHSVSGIPGSCP